MVTDVQRARRKDPGDSEKCNLFPLHPLYSKKDEVDEITEDQEVDIKTARKQAHKEAYSDSPRKIILLYPDDTYETYDPR